MAAARSEPVVILCGGRGTRLQEHAQAVPKPLVEIGGRPIVWHVVQIYAAQGFRHFVLCTGYLSDRIESFATAVDWGNGIRVECIDTGDETPTGGRIKLVEDHIGGGTFCVTYADGVADIDLSDLLDTHHDAGALATVTVVRPLLPFGVVELEGDGKVAGFHEKPRSEHWINGGFLCLEPDALAYLTPSSVLEREPLEGLASDGQLRAYRHTGFWKCLDTYKDAMELNDLWEQGHPPWRVWT